MQKGVHHLSTGIALCKVPLYGSGEEYSSGVGNQFKIAYFLHVLYFSVRKVLTPVFDDAAARCIDGRKNTKFQELSTSSQILAAVQTWSLLMR